MSCLQRKKYNQLAHNSGMTLVTYDDDQTDCLILTIDVIQQIIIIAIRAWMISDFRSARSTRLKKLCFALFYTCFKV